MGTTISAEELARCPKTGNGLHRDKRKCQTCHHHHCDACRICVRCVRKHGQTCDAFTVEVPGSGRERQEERRARRRAERDIRFGRVSGGNQGTVSQ